MKHSFRINGTVWHASRYWVSLGEQGFVGWNTRFQPYRITKITAERITCEPMVDAANNKPITLKRKVMENRGKQYHTRFHEYFYAVKPDRDPERLAAPNEAVGILNLSLPYTRDDVKRAYKRMARTVHPDTGGSSAAFIQLQQARDAALRTATE